MFMKFILLNPKIYGGVSLGLKEKFARLGISVSTIRCLTCTKNPVRIFSETQQLAWWHLLKKQ